VKGPNQLHQCEDRWQTRMGAAMLPKRTIFRGKDLHQDLADWPWIKLYIYGITGRIFDEADLKILNAIWVFTSYPDPRIWNNRIAGFCGTARSPASLAVAAALSVSDAEIYGGQPLLNAIKFLESTVESISNGGSLSELITSELKQFRKIAGYGRPKASSDERIKPMLRFLRRLDYQHGPYMDMAFKIESLLLETRRRMRLNYAGLVAALCADIGLSAQESYLFVVPIFTAGFLPCYIDGVSHAEGTLFPLRCERINYLGPNQRSWD